MKNDIYPSPPLNSPREKVAGFAFPRPPAPSLLSHLSSFS